MLDKLQEKRIDLLKQIEHIDYVMEMVSDEVTARHEG